MNLTLLKFIGVLALRNDPEEIISKTPAQRFGLFVCGSSVTVVRDDVDPVTDIVTDKDVVVDPSIVGVCEAVTTELLNSVENDSLNDEESTVVMSAPGITPMY